MSQSTYWEAVWPDWAIYWTLGNFSKSVATINLTTFLGNFCKGIKIFNFSGEIILGNFYRHLATFYWSHCWEETLVPMKFPHISVIQPQAPTNTFSVFIFFMLKCESQLSCSNADLLWINVVRLDLVQIRYNVIYPFNGL